MSRSHGYGSVYQMRDGDPSVFGDFNCTVLGEPLIVTVDRIEDDDARCLDILGVPFRRGDSAIHISGLDEYGEVTCGGFVREMGWQSARRVDGKPVQSTMGTAEAVVIVMHTRHDRWNAPHMAQFSDAAYFVTRRGLSVVFSGAPFTPDDVAERIDAARETARGERPMFPVRSDPQHRRAIRRLLEGAVGAPRGVSRVGRWGYVFSVPPAPLASTQKGYAPAVAPAKPDAGKP